MRIINQSHTIAETPSHHSTTISYPGTRCFVKVMTVCTRNVCLAPLNLKQELRLVWALRFRQEVHAYGHHGNQTSPLPQSYSGGMDLRHTFLSSFCWPAYRRIAIALHTIQVSLGDGTCALAIAPDCSQSQITKDISINARL